MKLASRNNHTSNKARYIEVELATRRDTEVRSWQPVMMIVIACIWVMTVVWKLSWLPEMIIFVCI